MTKPSQAKPQANLPPIRNKIDIKDSLAQKVAAKKPKVNDELLDKIKRDNTPMPDYYKAWDKIAKQAEEEFDEQENQPGQIKFQEPKAP